MAVLFAETNPFDYIRPVLDCVIASPSNGVLAAGHNTFGFHYRSHCLYCYSQKVKLILVITD